MRPLLAAALLALPLIPAGASRAATPLPPAPTRRVTDSSAFLSPGGRESLDQKLEAWERSTGHQFIVWIGPTSGDLGPEDFATKAFRSWGVGKRERDDGLALFVFAEDRKVRFEVGYGLEGTLPDAIASRIIREAMLPRLAAGDQDGAVTAAVDAATALISSTATAAGVAPSPPPGTRLPRELTKGQIVLAAIVGLLFLLLLVTNPRLAIWLLINIVSSASGGRSSGGSGGWSGGGGRSGGGGATGSW